MEKDVRHSLSARVGRFQLISRSEEAKTENLITLTNSPEEALKDADVVVTDTWYAASLPTRTSL